MPVHLSINTANMDDDEVLLVAGMAAAAVTVIVSTGEMTCLFSSFIQLVSNTK